MGKRFFFFHVALRNLLNGHNPFSKFAFSSMFLNMLFPSLFLFGALLTTTASSLPQLQNDLISTPADTTENTDRFAGENAIDVGDSGSSNGMAQKGVN